MWGLNSKDFKKISGSKRCYIEDVHWQRCVSIEEINDVIDKAIQRDRDAMVKRPIEASACHIDVVEALETLRGNLLFEAKANKEGK